MPTLPFVSPSSVDGSKPPPVLRRRAPLAMATAAIGLAAAVVGVSASPHLGLTQVPAQPKVVGVASPNYLSPELIETVVAQGSWVLENPSADGVIRYYGYLHDASRPLVPMPPSTVEAQKTEPDKNTYLVLKGQHGAASGYDYGTHFLYQGHEIGPRGYITRINLDADPSHRVTLLASTQVATANLPAGDLPTFDGSVWDPFTRTLLFSAEGNGTSSGGIWEATPDLPATTVDQLGLIGRGGYEGMQLDSDGNIWLVEDIGGKVGTAGGNTNNAKQPNSFIYRLVPYDRTNLSGGGQLQVLQADGKNGTPVTFSGGAAPTQAQIDADIVSGFMKDLHTYGQSFATRWITIHDTKVDGTATFNANLLAKAIGGTPFKRPENGQFRPGSRFTDFIFTETGDTDATSGANAAYGGWGGLLRLVQRSPSAMDGRLSPFYVGDQTHTGFDNITFLDSSQVIAVEDAGDKLHSQRGLLDSGFIFPVATDHKTPTPFRFLGEGRDPSATIDATLTGNGNDGDNEITGMHLSNGDPKVRGLIGTTNPTFGRSNGDSDARPRWRLFWTQQHGDNATYEVIKASR